MTGTSGKYPKIFVSRQKNQSQLWIPGKPRKIGVWVSGAEIQTSAVNTRTAVWVSTAEKFSKIFLGETRNFSRKFRGVSAPALYKNPAVIQCFSSQCALHGLGALDKRFMSVLPTRCKVLLARGSGVQASTHEEVPVFTSKVGLQFGIFFRALTASTWGHCSQTLIFTVIW